MKGSCLYEMPDISKCTLCNGNGYLGNKGHKCCDRKHTADAALKKCFSAYAILAYHPKMFFKYGGADNKTKK